MKIEPKHSVCYGMTYDEVFEKVLSGELKTITLCKNGVTKTINFSVVVSDGEKSIELEPLPTAKTVIEA